ncbi:MAG: hypothetical protein QXQ94_06535 [Candidatus Bathyarchaeia archaeon]
MGKVKHPFKYGIRKEQVVAERLRRKGYSVKLSKASRGASDIKVRGPKRWNIQVKASLSGNRSLSSYESRRIKIQARKEKAIPVYAQVCGRHVTFRSLRTGKRLRP